MSEPQQKPSREGYGCSVIALFVVVVWPLLVVPYLRWRMPNVEIAISFFEQTITASMMGAVAGVALALALSMTGVGVIFLAAKISKTPLNKASRQPVIVALAAIATIGALVAGIVLLEQFAFGDQGRWHDFVSQRKSTTCIGAGCGGNYEGGDSAMALIVVVTVQFTCALAVLAVPAVLVAERKRSASEREAQLTSRADE